MHRRLEPGQAGPAMTATGKFRLPSHVALLALGACASVPTGPTVPVMPGTGKSLDQFRADDAVCQHYALEQIGGTPPEQAATGSGSATVSPANGVATGAAMAEKRGAGVGAARTSSYDMQRRYDLGYIQCMYAQGHRVPVLGPMAVRPAQASHPSPPGPNTLPSVPR